jgi:uncharacterized membrane protein YqjE
VSDSDAPGRTTGGLFDSLRSLLATLVAMAHTRVDLFGTELEEELQRVVTLAVGAMLVLALANLALLFSALVVIAAFWDTHRVAAVAGVAAGFGTLAVVSYFFVRARTRRRTRLLAATLGELHRDLQALDERRKSS